MNTNDVIAGILGKEGVEYVSAFPGTPLIDAAAEAGIRPIICRQERVGVGIADGYTRVTNGRPPGVFAMQSGPGAENAFPGVATAFSDGVPMLLLPQGHPLDRDGVFPQFSSVRSYASVTKSVEQINSPHRVVDSLRRAFARLRMGRPGPVMVEVPADVGLVEVDPSLIDSYRLVRATAAQADPRDVMKAAAALLKAKHPVIQAGQGVLYAEATDELVELAELLQVPVTTTLEGKSAFPEGHPLDLGTGCGVMTGPVHHFVAKADLIFAIGASLTKHLMTMSIPAGKTLIHAINDPIDIGKDYHVDYPIIGDAKLVLHQFIEACQDLLGGKPRSENDSVAAEIASVREAWLDQWMPKLRSEEVPITPYRVIWEFMDQVDPADAIVTHDSGSARDQLMPFYRSAGPRSYLGWGKSHALGTGLGLNIGAKLAAPDKLAVNFMGDAAFGMTGLDFETAVRSDLPILTVVFNNSTMAIERYTLVPSHRLYHTRDLGGDYAGIARDLGGWAERVEHPSEVAPAIERAKRATEDGHAALLEVITSEEIDFSLKRALG